MTLDIKYSLTSLSRAALENASTVVLSPDTIEASNSVAAPSPSIEFNDPSDGAEYSLYEQLPDDEDDLDEYDQYMDQGVCDGSEGSEDSDTVPIRSTNGNKSKEDVDTRIAREGQAVSDCSQYHIDEIYSRDHQRTKDHANTDIQSLYTPGKNPQNDSFHGDTGGASTDNVFQPYDYEHTDDDPDPYDYPDEDPDLDDDSVSGDLEEYIDDHATRPSSCNTPITSNTLNPLAIPPHIPSTTRSSNFNPKSLPASNQILPLGPFLNGCNLIDADAGLSYPNDHGPKKESFDISKLRYSELLKWKPGPNTWTKYNQMKRAPGWTEKMQTDDPRLLNFSYPNLKNPDPGARPDTNPKPGNRTSSNGDNYKFEYLTPDYHIRRDKGKGVKQPNKPKTKPLCVEENKPIKKPSWGDEVGLYPDIGWYFEEGPVRNTKNIHAFRRLLRPLSEQPCGNNCQLFNSKKLMWMNWHPIVNTDPPRPIPTKIWVRAHKAVALLYKFHRRIYKSRKATISALKVLMWEWIIKTWKHCWHKTEVTAGAMLVVLDSISRRDDGHQPLSSEMFQYLVQRAPNGHYVYSRDHTSGKIITIS